MHAGCRLEAAASSRKLHLKYLYPMLPLGDIVVEIAGLGTLWRNIKPRTAIATS